MSTQHAQCDPRRVESFLSGELVRDEQRRFEEHLESCADCRARLETTAAAEDFWTEASTYLLPDGLDRESMELHLRVPDLGDVDDTGDFVRSRELHDADRPDALRIEAYLDATDDPRMLGRFGGYEVVGIVGCGGMGVVLKGYESALDRYVAIKVLAPHLSTSGAARKRFAREARAAAAVLHENVVAIHRVAEANGLPYLVMPYLAGESLQKRLDQRGPLELVEILRIAKQVAAGLAAAHAQGLVHRDIKPANVLLDKGVERVVLTDFGLARAADDASLTRSGVIAGTPQYMSPEQARGEPVDARSDLFSLGSLMYAMCTGRPPFRAETTYGVIRRITEAEAHPLRDVAPGIPEWFCEIVGRLHAKRADERFESAASVSELLGRWLAHVQSPADVPPPTRIRRRKLALSRLRRPHWLAAAAVLVLVAAIGTVVAMIAGSDYDRSLAIGATFNSVMPEPHTESTQSMPLAPFEPLIDDVTLQQEYEQLRERSAQLEAEWAFESRVTTDPWSAAANDLRQQMDSLSQRIDRGGL